VFNYYLSGNSVYENTSGGLMNWSDSWYTDNMHNFWVEYVCLLLTYSGDSWNMSNAYITFSYQIPNDTTSITRLASQVRYWSTKGAAKNQ
jgi:hypothetical protein